MQNKVDEVFVGKVRLLSIEGERSGQDEERSCGGYAEAAPELHRRPERE